MIALIPARANSKRLPRKNIRRLGGKPLIRWTIEAALESECFDLVAVCSDDISVLTLAQSPCVCVKRDSVPDDQRDIEWVADALTRLLPWPNNLHDPSKGYGEFAILRPTSPFRSADTIRRAKDQWDACKHRLDSMRAMRPTTETGWKQWVVEDEVSLWSEEKVKETARLAAEALGPENTRVAFRVPLLRTMRPLTTAAAKKHLHSFPTQALEDTYIQTAGLEIAHSRTVLEKGTIAGDQVGMFLVEGPEALDINTEEDWERAEALVAQGIVTVTS